MYHLVEDPLTFLPRVFMVSLFPAPCAPLRRVHLLESVAAVMPRLAAASTTRRRHVLGRWRRNCRDVVLFVVVHARRSCLRERICRGLDAAMLAPPAQPQACRSLLSRSRRLPPRTLALHAASARVRRARSRAGRRGAAERRRGRGAAVEGVQIDERGRAGPGRGAAILPHGRGPGLLQAALLPVTRRRAWRGAAERRRRPQEGSPPKHGKPYALGNTTVTTPGCP